MNRDASPFPIIKTGAPQAAVVHAKAQRAEQMQSSTGIGAKPYNVAGVWRYLRLKKDDVKHGSERA